jgi:predicted  nucleic acid-binding Zn-ribbon protein
MLKLLKEDEEFRYAVAGLLGLEEILKRLDRNEQELVRLREDMTKMFEKHDERFARIEEEIRRIWQEIERLREDMVKGFERHDLELAKLERR